MTVFGNDVSQYQPGLEAETLKAEGSKFVVARCSRGSGYYDPMFDSHWLSAKGEGMLFAAYHFMYAEAAATITAQVNTIDRALGDKSIPIWIDCEKSTAGGNPRVKDAERMAENLTLLGYTVAGIYLPKWYWESIRSPVLSTEWRGLWSSRYVKGYQRGGMNVLYPGDNSDVLWQTYTDREPDIAQFTSSFTPHGYTANTVDANAFRGTRAELAEKGWFIDYRKPKAKNAHAIINAAEDGIEANANNPVRRRKFQTILELAETLVEDTRV